MTYCKYVQQFQIQKALFMGRNLDWNKTTIIMDFHTSYCMKNIFIQVMCIS